MSDHDAPHDPMDKAYAQAEAMLSDDAARAARRARVLAAAAQATPEAATSAPRPGWRRGGWLVAASVAGLSVLVAIQIRPPVVIEQPAVPTAPAAPAVPAVTPEQTPSVSPPAVKAPPAARSPRTSVAVPAAPAAPTVSADVAKVEPAPPPPPPPPPPSAGVMMRARPEAPPAMAPAPAAPPRDSSLSEIVVTGSRIEASREARAKSSVRSLADEPAARLRDAAARGRTAEVAALLARDAPVDAADDEGDTALMKSVRANHPGVAALLRKHGASLDLKNEAGESARGLATSIGDAKLNRALGLDR